MRWSHEPLHGGRVKRAAVDNELTEMRKVETLAIEMRSAINLFRAELLADDGQDSQPHG